MTNMVNQFDKTTTVDGSDVIIYNKETGPHEKIHGAYLGPNEDWHMASWFNNGHFHPVREGNLQPTCGIDLSMTVDVPTH